MVFVRKLSIHTQLIMLATVSACVAVLVSSSCFVLHDVNMLREAKLFNLHVHADMMGVCADDFRTAETAGNAMNSFLQTQPTIVHGCFFDIRGRLLATYERDQGYPIPICQPESSRLLKNGYLEFFHTIKDNDTTLGTLYLLDDNSDVNAQFLYYIKIAMLVTFISCCVSLLIATRLQAFISRPIKALSAAAENVRVNANYDIRVDEHGGGEISTLCSSFNQMLAQIGKSKSQLSEARDELEKRVGDRTSQLRMEIAERKKIEADLMRALDDAKDMNDARCLFLASMSHEIRTPLNAILGFSDLLLKGVERGEGERKTFLSTILTSGRHLLELINGILDYSKMDAGQMELEIREFSPDHLIAEVLSVLDVKAREKGLVLSREWVTGVPATIKNDESRMRQSIFNLVGNAIKFTDEGQILVRAALLVNTSPAILQVEIIDTGIGISNDKLNDIFEPFVQADSSITRKYGGTGLGLAITRKIARAMGGDLVVTSELNVGSTFRLTFSTGNLDGVAIHTEPIAEIKAQQKPNEILRTDLSGAKILVVEDTDANRKLVNIILTRAKADVDLAVNGQEGRDMATQKDYDLILMDMQMPVMDGYEATRQLRAVGFNKPIYALTSNALKGDAIKCRDAGCSGYITKPIDTDYLIRTIRETLDRKPIEGVAITSESFADSEFRTPEMQDHSDVKTLSDSNSEDYSTAPATSFTSAPAYTTESGNTIADDPTRSDFIPPMLETYPNDPIKTIDSIQTLLPVSDDEELREVVQEFVVRMRRQVQELREAAENDDRELLHSIAHIIRGSGGTAGFPCFTEPATQLMATATSAPMENISGLVDTLTELAHRLEAP